MGSQNRQPFTPALPSRSKGNLLSNSQSPLTNLFKDPPVQKPKETPGDSMRKGKFRQLVRSENVCKPPLPFDKKELPATPSIDQKSESKNNTTMETTPEISCKLGSKEEEKVDKDEKYKDNLNVFNKFMLPEGKTNI